MAKQKLIFGLSEQELIWRRNSTLKKDREPWMTHWRDLSSNILPRNGRFLINTAIKDAPRYNSIYDNTATLAQRILSAGMMAGMTSPARPWFRLGTGDTELSQSDAVKLWLSKVTRMMLSIFSASNTYRSLHHLYGELGVFGTGASVVTDDFDAVIRHYPQTVGEYALAVDFKGDVDTIYRQVMKPVGSLVSEFGYENCSTRVKNLWDAAKLDDMIEICHAVEPRVDYDPRSRRPEEMPWKSVYFEVAADKDKNLKVGGFKRFPALAPRWDVLGGDVYGNSPGMECLGDVRQLQHEQLRKAVGIDYMTKPPVQAPVSMKGREIDMLPGGTSFYDGNGPNAGIKTLFDVNIRLDHLLMDIQDVRGRIRSSFYADLFLMLSQTNMPNMTATEVAERHEEKLIMLGPVLERLHNELLAPLIEMTFMRMIEAGIVPEPPPEMQGQQLDVEFVSILAQAQRAIGTNSMDRYVVTLGNIAAMKPGVLDKFDEDEWADQYADMLGVDPKLIVPDKKVALVRKARADAAAQQQKLDQAQQLADAGAKAGTVDMGGGTNAGMNIINQLSGYNSPGAEEY